jgi:hypothetical protein
LDQLLTSAAGNGALVKISLITIKRIGNVLVIVTLKFVRLNFVFVVVVAAAVVKNKLC